MTALRRRRALYAAIVLLLALHDDFWLRDDARLMLGLPVGLVYHIGYCLAAAVLMLALVTLAWPRGLEVEDREDER